MYKVISIGDVILDTHLKIDDATVECGLDGRGCKLCLDYATKVPVKDSFQTIGGNATNISLATTKLGLKTAVVSTVGADANGEIILNELKKNKTITMNDLMLKLKDKYKIKLSRFHVNRIINDNNISLKLTHIKHVPTKRFGKDIDIKKQLKTFFDEVKKYA